MSNEKGHFMKKINLVHKIQLSGNTEQLIFEKA